MLFKNKTALISKSDFLQYEKQLYFKRKKGIRAAYFIGGILLVTGGIVCSLKRDYYFVPAFYAIGAFYLFCSKNYYKMAAGKKYLRVCQAASSEYEWYFYENNAQRKADSEILINYADITDIFETENCLVLYNGKTAYWLDKAGFEKGSLDEFIAFLKENFNIAVDNCDMGK